MELFFPLLSFFSSRLLSFCLSLPLFPGPRLKTNNMTSSCSILMSEESYAVTDASRVTSASLGSKSSQPLWYDEMWTSPQLADAFVYPQGGEKRQKARRGQQQRVTGGHRE